MTNYLIIVDMNCGQEHICLDSEDLNMAIKERD